ncbi:MAG: ParB N-terminal domain-containing protein, partial [Candidatus Bathyarchaeota archaeon]|nr:ParB N-terminal domain-containing protein [Candidatus Bathyarchaeota archaeon]
DYRDQLQATSRQTVNDGTPETTWYVYDGSGERVRKITESANGNIKQQRIYLDGFEIFRKYNTDGSIKLERETLHITDDNDRVALIETRTKGDDDSPAQLIRFQFSNHLGSASLELDDQAQIISYEEYTPYGSSSYQAVRSNTETSKRYRYTGMERDEESGLSSHGVRYYATWLGKWISSDPLGLIDGVNLYRYSKSNPIMYRDNLGTDSESPDISVNANSTGNTTISVTHSEPGYSVTDNYFDTGEMQRLADSYEVIGDGRVQMVSGNGFYMEDGKYYIHYHDKDSPTVVTKEAYDSGLHVSHMVEKAYSTPEGRRAMAYSNALDAINLKVSGLFVEHVLGNINGLTRISIWMLATDEAMSKAKTPKERTEAFIDSVDPSALGSPGGGTPPGGPTLPGGSRSGVPRVGELPVGVVELSINKLSPIHDVPRAGVPKGHIGDIAKNIRENGYDVTKPASATRLPTGEMIISGGHHRIAAMKSLGEKTVPIKIYNALDDPVKTAQMIGIGKTTGKLSTNYVPALSSEEILLVNKYLQLWRNANPEQVKNVFFF